MTTEMKYGDKFDLLDQKMRWEVADEIRVANLAEVNRDRTLIEPADGFYVQYGKRALDVAIATGALVASAPVSVAACALTLIDLGRPVLFTQRRLGKDGKEFVIFKLRTMRNDTDADGRPLLGEKRVTRLGKLIRRSSIDELFNFWNVVKGDMSIIGPRPLVPEYHDRFSKRHRQRLSVKPGLECPTPEPVDHAMSYDEQFDNDCWYVENVSLKTDLHMIRRVIEAALDRRQNAARGSSSRGSFLGYDESGKVITTKNIPHWALDKVLRRHGLLP